MCAPFFITRKHEAIGDFIGNRVRGCCLPGREESVRRDGEQSGRDGNVPHGEGHGSRGDARQDVYGQGATGAAGFGGNAVAHLRIAPPAAGIGLGGIPESHGDAGAIPGTGL